MVNPEFDLARLTPVDEEPDRLAILDAVSVIVPDFVWRSDRDHKLEHFRGNTEIEGVEASPDGIFWLDEAKKFEAVATVYVTKKHSITNQSSEMSDSFPAYVRGHFDGKTVTIDEMELDLDSQDG